MNLPASPRRPTGQFGFLPSPQPVGRTVARAFISLALVQRTELETEPAAEELQDLLDVSLAWLRQQGFADELEDTELAALEAPLGALPEATREHFASFGEAACVIGWALRRTEVPAFDVDADGSEVAEALGWLSEAGVSLATGAHLRPREEVSALLDAVGAVHWRLLEHARQPSRISMERWAASVHDWPQGLTPLELSGADLALGGRPLEGIDDRTLLDALRRVGERHRTALWLLGQERAYGSVTIGG
jgi:hypothetical protein